jgi:hypothetical protein
MPPPWTQNQVLAHYRFTNVFRELDRTTVALRERHREPMRSRPEVLPLVVALRWFNRTETFDRLYRIADHGNMSLVAMLSEEDGRRELEERLRCHAPPYVTGAYIVKSPPGMDKLSGIFRSIGRFMDTSGWRDVAERLLVSHRTGATIPDFLPPVRTLQSVWEWLLPHDQMGPFMAYEVVSDLRHTDLLCGAPDVATWANPGPGAMRGLNRLHGRDLHYTRRSHPWCAEMRELLEMSRDSRWWPAEWPAWEMREVEHTCCEFDKYARVTSGEGRPRGVWSPRTDP